MMPLVDYGSSDESDGGQATAKPASTGKTVTKKAGASKLVDQSNPGKVKITLDSKSTASSSTNGDSKPSSKRQKTKSESGGFNSFLPAPKRTGQANGVGQLGRGVSLKTDAAPSFQRDTPPPLAAAPVADEPSHEQDSQPASAAAPTKESVEFPAVIEMAPVKKAPMFKPLSVGKKQSNKKKKIAESGQAIQPSGATLAADSRPEERPQQTQFSLFSSTPSNTESKTHDTTVQSEPYQPMLYQASLASPSMDNSQYPDTSTHNAEPYQQQSDQPDTLDDIADSLNLSASQRRQLMGRGGGKGGTASAASVVKVTNFNTDAEYAANETMRQSGDVVQHQPVRTVAPGKHSLKQLVSSAMGQQDALDEKFAEGRRNKKEVGGRYGW